MINLAIFCSGYGSNFQAILDAIARKKLSATAALMVSDNPKAYALKRADQNKIPIVLLSPHLFKDKRSYEEILTRILKSQKVDLVVLAGFMRILSPYFIKAWKHKIINVHPSYLPSFKGAHAIRDAFEAKAKFTGVTIHWVTEKVDAGPIILQEKVPILKSDTLQTLETRIHKVEHRLYPKAIQKLII